MSEDSNTAVQEDFAKYVEHNGVMDTLTHSALLRARRATHARLAHTRACARGVRLVRGHKRCWLTACCGDSAGQALRRPARRRGQADDRVPRQGRRCGRRRRRRRRRRRCGWQTVLTRRRRTEDTASTKLLSDENEALKREVAQLSAQLNDVSKERDALKARLAASDASASADSAPAPADDAAPATPATAADE